MWRTSRRESWKTRRSRICGPQLQKTCSKDFYSRSRGEKSEGIRENIQIVIITKQPNVSTLFNLKFFIVTTRDAKRAVFKGRDVSEWPGATWKSRIRNWLRKEPTEQPHISPVLLNIPSSRYSSTPLLMSPNWMNKIYFCILPYRIEITASSVGWKLNRISFLIPKIAW